MPPIEYTAPIECPSREELVARVDRRVATREPGSDARSFAVRVTRTTSGGYEGRLTVRGEADGSTRTAHEATCEATVDAMALFIAIALAPRQDPSTSPDDRPDAPQATEPPPARSPLPPASEPPRSLPATSPTSPPPSSPPSTHRLEWAAGARANLLTAGELFLGGRVFAEAGIHRPNAFLLPSLRLSAGWSTMAIALEPSGEATFHLVTVRVEPCLGVRLATRWRFVPCALAEAGELSASVDGLPRTGQSATGWSAIGGAIGLAWHPVRAITFEASLAILAPFVRKRFGLVDPVREIFVVPAVWLEAGAGAALTYRFD